MFRLVSVIVLTLAFTGKGCASDEPLLTPMQTEQYNRLTRELIAPCCWREPIAIHRSAETLQMLDEVRLLVAEGRSEEEIKAIYVARYGARILADPPGTERRWLYLIPVFLVVATLVMAVLRLRALVARKAPQRTAPPPKVILRVRKETENGWI